MDYYGTQQDACPRCGSTADVRTVQDLVDMYGQLQQGNPMQGRGPYQQYGQQYGPGPGPGPSSEAWYGPESGGGPGWPLSSPGPGSAPPGQDIADAVLGGVAGRFIGKAIRNRMQRVVEERIMPTLNARAEQSRQQLLAIAQRYPELRACLRDQVTFLAGGTRTVPLSEVPLPNVTLAQADALVARLREP